MEVLISTLLRNFLLKKSDFLGIFKNVFNRVLLITFTEGAGKSY
jgi:hypothetical protein